MREDRLINNVSDTNCFIILTQEKNDNTSGLWYKKGCQNYTNMA